MSLQKPGPTPPPPTGTARLAIVASRFNQAIVDRLVAGAETAFQEAGLHPEQHATFWVPGAFELPLAAQWLANTGRWDAILCLGCVIRGDTDHYDYVCDAATRGILQVSLAAQLPVLFGVLTCDNEQQALDRAGGTHGNKGADAAQAALAMVRLRQQLAAPDGPADPYNEKG